METVRELLEAVEEGIEGVDIKVFPNREGFIAFGEHKALSVIWHQGASCDRSVDGPTVEIWNRFDPSEEPRPYTHVADAWAAIVAL